MVRTSRPKTKLVAVVERCRAQADTTQVGATPLHAACSRGLVSVVLMLLEHGALLEGPMKVRVCQPGRRGIGATEGCHSL